MDTRNHQYFKHQERSAQDAMRHEAHKLQTEKRGYRLAENEPDRQYVLKHVWHIMHSEN